MLAAVVGRGCQAEAHPKVKGLCPPFWQAGLCPPKDGGLAGENSQLSLVLTLSLAALRPPPQRPRESEKGQVCLPKPGEEL